MKQCGSCGEIKPFDQFQKHTVMKDGLRRDCRACRRIESAAYSVANREAISAKNKRHRQEHRDEYRRRNAVYYAENVEELRRRKREYYWRNRERLLSYQVDYRAANGNKIRERNLAYNRRNSERLRQWHADYRAQNTELFKWRDKIKAEARRAQKLSSTISPFAEADLKDKFKYWNDSCWVCGEPATAVDHVKPLSRGGSHMLCNLRPICRSCNSRKYDTWPLRSRAAMMGIAD